MDFIRELTFTAFLAIILCFVVAKVVGTFAVFNSSTDCNTAVCSVDEGVAAKEETLNRGLSVGKIKPKKRVRFVDDDDEVVIKRVDHYEGSENLVLCEDSESIVGQKGVNERSNGLNEDIRGEISKKLCFDMREMHNLDIQDKGCEQMEYYCCDGDENEKILETSKMKSVILEEDKNEVLLDSENIIIPQNEGNRLVGSGENKGLISENSCIDLVLDTKVSDSCHIKSDIDHVSTSHIEDSFAGSREDDGLIAANSSINSVGNNEGSKSCYISSSGIFEGDVKDESVECEDDDWEGIERSELEKVFAEAVNFMEYGAKNDDRLAKLSSDLHMQLYGLHKVAIEGACHEPQPMALKVSARAKWNSWQRLGTTSQEVAMEQYIKILQDNIPGWMNSHSSGDSI